MSEASFRLAYDEAVRALRAQADEHDSLRTRAGTILATSLVVTSFFGGQALASSEQTGPLSLAWLAVVALYVVATCGALLFSGYRHIEIFGVANLIAVALLAWLTIDGFASLWCAYAALAAGAIALHMRYAKPHRAIPYVIS